jgi:very-short-patch-repair endonuclease
MRAIAERSEPQLGLITTDQLTLLGVSRQGRRSLEAHGAIERLGTGVWRLPGHPPSWRQQLLAATLAAGPDAVVSHLAGCAWWRFEGVEPGAVAVTVPRPQRPRGVPGTVHQSRDLLPVDVDRRGIVPVTTPSRSLIDAAPALGRVRLETALDAATLSNLVQVPFLRWRVESLRRRGRPGVGALLDVLPPPQPREREESWLERRLTGLIREAGLPPPRLQARLRHSGGRARVDLVYDETRLVIEVDGHATHATRRQRQADAERAARLTAAGWRLARFTYEDVVERPAYVADTIRSLLQLTPADLVT